MCFSPYFGIWGGGGLPRGLGHNLLTQISRLSSSRIVVPLPSSRCLAEGNRFFFKGTRTTQYMFLGLVMHVNVGDLVL